MSEPVEIPVIVSKYFLRKVLPDLGNDVYETLNPSWGFKNLDYLPMNLGFSFSYLSRSLLKKNAFISLMSTSTSSSLQTRNFESYPYPGYIFFI